jgi:hypothetical protein
VSLSNSRRYQCNKTNTDIQSTQHNWRVSPTQQRLHWSLLASQHLQRQHQR